MKKRSRRILVILILGLYTLLQWKSFNIGKIKKIKLDQTFHYQIFLLTKY